MASNPSGLAGALAGVMAVASGACETVLVYRCLTRSAGHQGGAAEGPDVVGGRDQFLTPYGYLGGIIVEMALKKRRWMAEYARPEADFGRIAVNARCGRGESGDWIGDGSRIGPGGDFPLNTAGGQLAEGRLHGIGFLNEAVLQLRGQCGERQVPGARVAVVTSGVYMQCGAMVLTA